MSTSCRTRKRYGMLSYLSDRSYDADVSCRWKLTRDRIDNAKNLFRKDLKSHFGCVNAIEFSHDGGEMFASGGDDRRVLIWETKRALDELAEPVSMEHEHNSNIFCLAMDRNNSKVFSGGNDELVLVHDIASGKCLDVYKHEEAIYGLCADPINQSVFASACADGRVLIYDIRSPASKDPFCLVDYVHAMHGVMYNPMEPRLLVTANSKEGIGLWDIRKPRSYLMQYGSGQQSCMSVRFSSQGDRILALRRRMPPVMYSIHSPAHLFQFDHSGYYNSCTMKSCCFAGDKDQFVLSGSDDFNLYMWKVPEESSQTSWVGEAHMVLGGHRSIVNQVRYSPENQLILSSGVEKIIKMWSLFPIPHGKGDLGGDDSLVRQRGVRPVYTHEEYINLVLHSGLVMNHDYSQQSVDEDPRMMAFFDSLVQRELEGWSSTDDEELDSEPSYIRRFAAAADEASGSSDEEEAAGSSPEQPNSPFSVAFASVMARQEVGIDGDESSQDRVSAVGGDFLLELNLADEVLNHREEHPASAASSARVDRPTGEATQPDRSPLADETLVGQEPRAQRRSISHLIAQRRKDYLASLQQPTKRSKKQRCKLLKKSKIEEEDSDSSSDDDNSSSGTGSASSSSSESEDSCTSLSRVQSHESLMPKMGKTSQLAKLKRLRGSVENDDLQQSTDQTDPQSSVLCHIPSTRVTDCFGDGVDECASESGPHLFSDDRALPGPSRGHRVQSDSHSRPLRSSTEPDTAPSSSTRSHTSTETESTSWTEFKRFRSRVARHYRSEIYKREFSSSDDSS